MVNQFQTRLLGFRNDNNRSSTCLLTQPGLDLTQIELESIFHPVSFSITAHRSRAPSICVSNFNYTNPWLGHERELYLELQIHINLDSNIDRVPTTNLTTNSMLLFIISHHIESHSDQWHSTFGSPCALWANWKLCLIYLLGSIVYKIIARLARVIVDSKLLEFCRQ